MEKIGVIVTAGGAGRRFGGEKPKQFLELSGIPVIIITLKRMVNLPIVGQVVLTVPENYIEVAGDLLSRYNLAGIKLTAGGTTRRESVLRGIRALTGNFSIIAVHDGVRPFFPRGALSEGVKKLSEGYGGAILAVPLRDTVKEVKDNVVISTLDRSRLYAVQTPQIFRREALLKGHALGEKQHLDAVDDSILVELCGETVAVIPGDYKNLKITWPEDLEFAEFLFTRYFAKELL
ncbi:2-C-methyl-D-erythritol 4-phosphate cytidylyltransferase [Carboxydothermus ferrireducens]|uniref:2-C-methyl-D-erythritol 4-phosphate cytidylyltransferase n=1 Tax=Carboxydothermus ferrireducens DSM 11255 TaxID=1119529 RepID=A0ABX2R9Q6_9THEO|nr:2-C-methyl-D-erythritol 4-phosphate cytidylyltransferase [Carboxydothermus ferrireducens]NYE57916.1 2-C-methyl-D-erythritol 4-phosphate cytidylyltransferase [Carboxydothermus ferrireducens DSM 11255]